MPGVERIVSVSACSQACGRSSSNPYRAAKLKLLVIVAAYYSMAEELKLDIIVTFAEIREALLGVA